MPEKPLILVTNDDGITAPGIRTLINIAKTIGDVVVVAPNSPQSGMGHAITVNSTLFLEKVTIDKELKHEYSCSGTPVDCVKIAMDQVLSRVPDLCISGINHGINSATSVLYSGTMSAAVEAAMSGVPAIGFSLDDFSWNANFSVIEPFVKDIIEKSLHNEFPKGVALNVNFPKPADGIIKGVKICRQANATWVEKFDERVNPHGKRYYWLTGTFHNHDTGTDTDLWALEKGYVSIVPTQFDLTAYNAINIVNNWNL
ncbi:5'/3'-nucleotidase SurE [Capnocytophaga sp. ARDL2]|uniref:5'/3'-nucleotidase SurE n=1 Tax=Capnocytophaga sp. ARDL2 TaxID=3238809 RepID=UPI0035579BF0